MRKPPGKVLTIDGVPAVPDIITDADYLEAITAQDAVLFAQEHEHKLLNRLRARLDHGAEDCAVKYFFDADRGIVRRRNQKVGS